MKKWFMLCSLIWLVLTGCGIQTVEQHEEMQEEERSQEEIKETYVAKPDELPAPAPIIEQPIVKKQQEAVQPEAPTAQTVEEQVKETPKMEQPPVKKSEPKQPTVVEKAPAPVTEPKTIEPQTPKKRYVTIAIEVHSLLTHYDQLHPSLQSEQYVPADGYVLQTTRYELMEEKETVWSVLQRAVKEHGIQLEYEGANENIYNNVYIEGINHLYEFSAGPLSGWMYSVNGQYPSYGCSQYVLQDGDTIRWQYTVDLGRDLGAKGT